MFEEPEYITPERAVRDDIDDDMDCIVPYWLAKFDGVLSTDITSSSGGEECQQGCPAVGVVDERAGSDRHCAALASPFYGLIYLCMSDPDELLLPILQARCACAYPTV